MKLFSAAWKPDERRFERIATFLNKPFVTKWYLQTPSAFPNVQYGFNNRKFVVSTNIVSRNQDQDRSNVGVVSTFTTSI